MLYYVKNDKKVDKYQVYIDEDRLSEIELEINENCSEVVHHEVEHEGDYFEKTFSPKTVKCYEKEKVGERRYFEESIDIYKYKYDEIIPSPLIEIIHKLYKEDINALDEIYGYENEIKLLSKEIKDIEKESMNINDTTKFNEIMICINDLTLSKQKLEKNIPYIEKIKSTITFKLVDSIKIDKVNEVNKFFEKNKDYNYSKIKIKRR